MRIRWTEPAARDLTNVCDYSQERNGPEAGRKLALRIYGAIGSLGKFPHLGREGRKSKTRELVISGTPFLAIYRFRDEAIEIARILHGAQKWP
ncbi:MAG: type II toxin-antitoxin system RelE/ParE family toxin [Terriglobales bacterium]|jgi:toxin ParE1/3/4